MRAKWGQNFLISPSTTRRIVEALGAGPADDVLEIGPGRGALTRLLDGRVKRLVGVELDQTLAAALRQRFPAADIVTADFLDWVPPAVPAGAFYVVGNLPYSAGGAILRKILDWPGWSRAVVMVQKEVALRMTAPPGGRGSGLLSLAVQAKADARRLFDVAPGAFRPVPRVTSTVVALTRLAVPRVSPGEEAGFFQTIRAAFGQRRKTLLNSLAHGLGLPKERVVRVLADAGLDGGRRAETVVLEDYRRLAKLLIPGDVHAEDVGEV